jgi:hypothetical protein
MNKNTHSNPEWAHWARELRKSNAAQPHLDKRTKRARNKKQALRKLLRNKDDD